MMPNPRDKFRNSPHGTTFHDAVASDWFQEAIGVAMQDFQNRLPTPVDMGTGSANGFRMDGAKLFVQIFTSLTETAPPLRPPPRANLRHNV